MKCLDCAGDMVNNLVMTKTNHIAYDLCEACGGLWLDGGELDKMAFQVEGSIEVSSQRETDKDIEPQKQCPRCDDTPLDKVIFVGYSDIVLDHCRNCGGFWLDGGELLRIDRELQKIMPVHGKGFSEFLGNVHVPYWHKRVRRKSSETDFEVEVLPLKHAELQSETDCACPACEATLERYKAYGIDLEGCSGCKGIWLDQDELRKLKDRCEEGSWLTLRWLDDEIDAIEQANATLSKRFCPKCDDVQLLSTSFGDSDILIDWCPSCHGTWLDRDEFEGIVKFLKDELNHLSSHEMKQKTIEELKEVWAGPEGTLSEILDAKAAISALINITIFEHPALVKVLLRFGDAARAIGF